MSSSKVKSKNKMMKLLKENERLLMDVESKLVEQLDNLKKEEIYLRTIIIKEKEEGEDNFAEEDDEAELDDDNINKAPLEHLNAASSSFYQMYTGRDVIEINDGEEEEEEEEEEDSEEIKKTEEEQSAEFQKLMRSMQGDG